ncbi:MAG: hypothetical protein KGZ79_02645 [Dethiobacter sp.]|jgi:prophage maintenance system killer protein|nr:hypothetical protein [Dethiobacter sp.]
MSRLTAKEVLLINYTLAKKQNLPQGVANLNKLNVALLRPESIFNGVELYPDIFLKAAALAEFIIKGLPFKAANTATALASGLLMLKKDGYAISIGEKEIFAFEQCLQNETVNVKIIADWFKNLVL